MLSTKTMFERRRKPLLASILILMMLASSSQAMEYFVHDSHGHASHSLQLLMPLAGEPTSPTMQSGSHSSSDAMAQHAVHGHAQSEHAAAEDCFCDETCCVSSVDFGSAVDTGSHALLSHPEPIVSDNYQSVALDLFLPPPNR